jgi:hypothetical protein
MARGLGGNPTAARRLDVHPPQGSSTPTKQRLHAKVASPYGHAQASPAVSLPDSPGFDSLSPAERLFEPPRTDERLPESAELTRLRGSDAFIGLAPLRERASEAFSGVMAETQESFMSGGKSSSLGLTGPLSKSAPDLLPSIGAGRTPQMERAVEKYLGRREQLSLAADSSEKRAKEARRRSRAKREAKGGNRAKKHAAAMERVKLRSEVREEGRVAHRATHREKGRAHVREKMLAQAKAKVEQMRKKAEGMAQPKLTFIDQQQILAVKANHPSAADHAFHGELDSRGVKMAQGKSPSNIEQQIALAATLPGPGAYLPMGAVDHRPALPGTTRTGSGAKPFQLRPPDDVEMLMRRTALLPSPGEYPIGHASPEPYGRYGSVEPISSTWSLTARADCFPFSPFKYATMHGLDGPGPAEYGDTNEVMFGVGGNITKPGMLRGGGRNDVDPRSKAAGVYNIARMHEPGPGAYGAPMPLGSRPNHNPPRIVDGLDRNYIEQVRRKRLFCNATHFLMHVTNDHLPRQARD